MAARKRCFASVPALRRFEPGVLCELFKRFPEYLAECGVTLPDAPDESNLNYQTLLDLCMGKGLPEELDDLFFHVTQLGNHEGWERILEEARMLGRKLSFPTKDRTYPSLAARAWLHDWPKNRDLLESAHARAQMHSRSSYVYYAPMSDHRARYKTPTAAALADFRKAMSKYFEGETGRGTSVLSYDFEYEIWFLVKYPGQVERHAAIADDGTATSHKFKPEEYDAVVYHKTYGDLRMNTNRVKEHKRYRIDFARLLLDQANAFHPKEKMVTLDPLLGNCMELFTCRDVPELTAIEPTEVSYSILSMPVGWMTWTADTEHSLFDYLRRIGRFLPEDAHSVRRAKFRYRLRGRDHWERLTVHAGTALNYSRDGDSVVLENWLRRRRFIRNGLGPCAGAA